MLFSTLALTLLGLLGLTSAIPTPIELAPRCGTTLVPAFLQQVSEANPSLVEPDTMSTGGDFHVSQSTDAYGNIIDRVYQIAGFEDIPSGSYGCQLGITFPPDYPITSTGVPTLNITTLFNGESSSICYPNEISWDSLYPPTSPPLGQGLFGTVTMTPGTTQVVNSESCPLGGGNLAFLFSIAVWETQPASVEFNEYVNALNGAGLAGVYLTYDS
ncbi:hypothetical protein D0Z07_2340 [Hyphodiscus hymeniophilus]|uniref:Ubiquitin 3 binding protein But2 C-terminal domain-containing protein n=1 Tax=Hyphodiscus hymeniophilus TaxID=353542 RepID=A0A9P7AYF7_9HELO|nr:hypothetical protein D0Z07_2340 [Hyphodiscus hymeniophilus]